MVKVEKKTAVELQEEYDKTPARKAGQWSKICDEVKKSGKGVKVSEITRGQCWALVRAAREKGLAAKVVDKSSAVVILAPVK